MSSEHEHTHECGHTDEDHLKRAQEMIMSGDLTPLYISMDLDQLITNLEGIISVIFSIAPDDDEFKRFLDDLHEEATAAFIDGTANDGRVREAALKHREQVQEFLLNEDFINDANDEIRALIEKHGVVAQQQSNDNDMPGFYL